MCGRSRHRLFGKRVSGPSRSRRTCFLYFKIKIPYFESTLISCFLSVPIFSELQISNTSGTCRVLSISTRRLCGSVDDLPLSCCCLLNEEYCTGKQLLETYVSAEKVKAVTSEVNRHAVQLDLAALVAIQDIKRKTENMTVCQENKSKVSALATGTAADRLQHQANDDDYIVRVTVKIQSRSSARALVG